MEAGARRIGDDHVGAHALPQQLGQHVPHLAGEERAVVDRRWHARSARASATAAAASSMPYTCRLRRASRRLIAPVPE